MNQTLLSVVWALGALAGAVTVVKARRFSQWYNNWTTVVRTQHPRISPPPTSKMRELNTRIMTWLIRFLGAWIVLLSVIAFLLVRLGG